MSESDWGTVPAWVSAVGSSLAVLATAAILARDRYLRRRAQAQLAVPIGEPVKVSASAAAYETLGVRVTNRSSGHLFGVRVHVVKPEWTMRRRYREESDPPETLDGHINGTIRALEDSTALDLNGLTAQSFGFEHIWHGLDFVPHRLHDASGKRWVRWPRGELRPARTSPPELPPP